MKTLTDVIHVRRDKVPDKIGSIYLPPAVVDNEETGIYVGTVTTVGPQCKRLQPGHRVMFNRASYAPMDLDGDKYCVMHESEVLCIVE